MNNRAEKTTQAVDTGGAADTPSIRLAAKIATDQATFNVLAAIDTVRQAHPEDFCHLLPAMEFMSAIFRPDWSKITVPEFVECLYSIVKHANFAVAARATLLTPNVRPN